MARVAREKLTELGLMTIQNIHQSVETLSGGQRQGVAVARAAAFGSRVVIMDEPTAALGVKESRRVLDLIQDVRARGLPIVLISHNMPHVFEVADRIHIHRLGRRLCVIDPKDYTHVRRGRLHDRRQGAAGGGDRPREPRRARRPTSARAPRGARASSSPSPARPAPASRPSPRRWSRRSRRSTPGEAALMPMDGYHFDNAILIERGLLARKGAPQTFDVDGLARDLARLRAGGPRGRRPGLRPHASTWRGQGRARSARSTG